MPRKKARSSAPRPVRTLEVLLEENERLEQQGRELMERVKALAAEVAEAKAESEDRRGKKE